MLVFLSDLHFSEAQSTRIGPFRFNRNLHPETYQAYFVEVNQLALANHIDKVDIILAGDILEISRSALWFEGPYRPYMNNAAVEPGSEPEALILSILQAIAHENNVRETLSLLRRIDDFFDMNVQLHLILGNHDRLANATPKIRKVVRDLFGLEGGSSALDHYRVINDEVGKLFCLVRHGHEYDPANFSQDLRRVEVIPAELPGSYYETACLGDIITSEFGAALPWYFKNHYGDESILGDETLLAIYQRLMEFDDVRPTTAWLSYLFSLPGVSMRETWRMIQPAFSTVISHLKENRAFMQTLAQSGAVNPFLQWIIHAILKTGLFRRKLPFWTVKAAMAYISRSIKLNSQVTWANKENLVKDPDMGCRCVVSGHTHFAEVRLISGAAKSDRYYLNTGTWRNVIPATQAFDEFGRLDAATKIAVFLPQEKNEPVTNLNWAFKYMSGVSYGRHRPI